mgnify:CR=1 FL=1
MLLLKVYNGFLVVFCIITLDLKAGLYTLTDRPGPAMAGQVRSFVRI